MVDMEYMEYMASVMNHEKFVDHIVLEKSQKKNNHLLGFMDKLGFLKKSRQDIMKKLITMGFHTVQLVQIKSAMEKGLTDKQLAVLIDNNVPAEKMKEIIELAVLENSR